MVVGDGESFVVFLEGLEARRWREEKEESRLVLGQFGLSSKVWN